MQRDTQRPSDKLKTARHCFSILGCAVLLLLAGQLAVSLFVDKCMPLFFPAGGYPTWLPLLIAYLAFFGIVFPLAALLLRRLPAAAPEKGKLARLALYRRRGLWKYGLNRRIGQILWW